MLVLTRKTNESIQIDDNMEIKILAIEGDQVKLGIDAPKSVDIHRKEIYTAIQQQNNEAADISPDLLNALRDSSRTDK